MGLDEMHRPLTLLYDLLVGINEFRLVVCVCVCEMAFARGCNLN